MEAAPGLDVGRPSRIALVRDECARQARRVDQLRVRPELRAAPRAHAAAAQRADPQLLRGRRGGRRPSPIALADLHGRAKLAGGLMSLWKRHETWKESEHESQLMRSPPSRGSSDPGLRQA